MSRGMNIHKYSFLSKDECQTIHDGSCRILSETGVKITNEQAIDLFKKEGAIYEKGRIKIPKKMVDKAINQTAKKIILGAKNPDNKIVIDPENPLVYFGTGGQALNVLHLEDGIFKKKPAVTQDLIDIIKLCEKLDNVDFITRPVEPDVPEDIMDLKKTEIFLENTTKHINLANLFVLDKLPEIIDMVQDKSLISFISCVIQSPLSLVSSTIDKFISIIQHDIPVSISSCPQAGTTSPLSEVGEIIQLNAEMLSAIVLANLVKPGAQVLYRGIPISSNLLVDASPRWCQPESIRRIAIMSDMTYHYKIPCCGTAAVSDEKEPNPQAVAEKTLSCVFESASGAQFINSALGMLEQVMTVCPEQYIIDNQIISHIKKLFSESSYYNIEKISQKAVCDSLEMFGVKVEPHIKNDISNRIDFIIKGSEEFTQDNINYYSELINDAINSGNSGNKFMKEARSGLRKGWLYMGEKIEGSLNLEEVQKIKNQILN